MNSITVSITVIIGCAAMLTTLTLPVPIFSILFTMTVFGVYVFLTLIIAHLSSKTKGGTGAMSPVIRGPHQ